MRVGGSLCSCVCVCVCVCVCFSSTSSQASCRIDHLMMRAYSTCAPSCPRKIMSHTHATPFFGLMRSLAAALSLALGLAISLAQPQGSTANAFIRYGEDRQLLLSDGNVSVTLSELVDHGTSSPTLSRRATRRCWQAKLRCWQDSRHWKQVRQRYWQARRRLQRVRRRSRRNSALRGGSPRSRRSQPTEAVTGSTLALETRASLP
jgi:hypothetical protein